MPSTRLLKIPITERCRKYGYVYWRKKLDEEVRSFLNEAKTVDVLFNNTPLGLRVVDYQFRRISIGATKTHVIERSCVTFELSFSTEGRLIIKCL